MMNLNDNTTNGDREPDKSRTWSKINFHHAGRKRAIIRRKWMGSWSLRIKIDGRPILRSLKTPEAPAAIELAKKMIDAEMKGDPEPERPRTWNKVNFHHAGRKRTNAEMKGNPEPERPRTWNKVNFYHAGRKRTIIRRKWMGNWSLRIKIDGREMWRSLKTPETPAAIDRAKKMIDAKMNGDRQAARALQARPGYPTLRELADIHIEKFGTDETRRVTALNYVVALKKIVNVALGLTLEQARADVLNGELIRKFEAAQERTIKRDRRGFLDHVSELRVRTSTQSRVRQARAMFRRATINWFDGFMLPDLTSFHEQGVRPPEREKPEPLDESAIRAMNAAAPQLAIDNPACYIAFLLFSRLGLRNCEQKKARMAWIIRDPATGKGHLAIKKRPAEQFKPKKSSRTLTIGPSLLAEIDKYWKPSPDGDYLIPARSKRHRRIIVDLEHSAWCAQWIKDRSRTSYELRRYAGSTVYQKTGKLEYVRQFLGHKDLKTTLDWYFYLKDDMPAVDLHDFVTA